jgi:hypothetical protein
MSQIVSLAILGAAIKPTEICDDSEESLNKHSNELQETLPDNYIYRKSHLPKTSMKYV